MKQTRITDYWKSPLGMIEIECQGRAITRVRLCPESIATSPESTVSRPSVLQQCIQELEAYFKGTLTTFTVPVEPEGTPFQQQVWNGLQEIPYGTTCTYAQLAEKIGNPRACRAVGNANNRNPVLILIPCHRVIGTNGTLTGYAAGLDIKEWLLHHERETAGKHP